MLQVREVASSERPLTAKSGDPVVFGRGLFLKTDALAMEKGE